MLCIWTMKWESASHQIHHNIRPFKCSSAPHQPAMSFIRGVINQLHFGSSTSTSLILASRCTPPLHLKHQMPNPDTKLTSTRLKLECTRIFFSLAFDRAPQSNRQKSSLVEVPTQNPLSLAQIWTSAGILGSCELDRTQNPSSSTSQSKIWSPPHCRSNSEGFRVDVELLSSSSKSMDPTKYHFH